MGEPFDGKKAAEIGFVTRAVPRADLHAEVRRIAEALREKDPVALRAAKQAYKHVRHMNWEQSADYLASKMDQVTVQDRSDGRSEGMKQFLDDKTFKPGLGAYKKS